MKIDMRTAGVTPTAELYAQAAAANKMLHTGEGAGNDFLGWVNLPSSIDATELAAIKAQADKLRAKAEVVICIGIGGSYLGAKAVLDALSNSFEHLRKQHDNPTVIFAGQNISEQVLLRVRPKLIHLSITHSDLVRLMLTIHQAV